MHDVPLAEATTSSLEALKAYSGAWKVAPSSGSAAAVDFVRRAIEIDPKFAIAYAYLGRLYGDIGESSLSSESTSKAYELRDRVSDHERFFITANYDRLVTGNLEKARETCELWGQPYPRDAGPPSLLSGAISVATGRDGSAAENAKEAIELDPNLPWGYAHLASSDIFLGRLDEASKTLQRAFDRKLEIPELLVMHYEIAFLEGDRAGMDRAAALSEGKTGAGDWIPDRQGSALAYSGHLHEARRLSLRAEELGRQAGERERSAQYEAEAALREALFGNGFEARRSATAGT